MRLLVLTCLAIVTLVSGCSEGSTSLPDARTNLIVQLNLAGLALMESQKPEFAVKAFETILQHRPNDLTALINRSWAHNRLGNHSAALDDAGRALTIQSNCVEALNL